MSGLTDRYVVALLALAEMGMLRLYRSTQLPPSHW